MAPPEKPTRLGRGLDALLARRDAVKPTVDPLSPQGPAGGTAGTVVSPAPTDAAPQIGESAGAAGTSMPSRQNPVTASVRPSGSTTTPTQTESTAKPTSLVDTGHARPSDTSYDTYEVTTNPEAPAYRMIRIEHIAPNPFQPRKEFHPQDLSDLESSLRSQGLLQPITVRPAPNHSGYELIAGERRLRAATRLGWKEIPAIVRTIDDRAMLTLAMVENLQRSDLDPIEEADGYQRLIDDFAATQQEVAEVVGKERSTVANALRLLALPASVKRMLQERKLSVGHARALLPLETERAMSDLARDVVAKTLSVREVEKRVRSTRPTPPRSGRKQKDVNSAIAATPAATAELRRVEELLRKKMQTTVHLHLSGKERGEVRIAFLSNDDLERVLQIMGINLDS